MPKEFDKLVQKIKSQLMGTSNPRTKKPYSESDIYAIAVAQWKKSHGGKAPGREDSPKWYCDESGREVREDVRLNWDEVIEIDQSKPVRFSEPLIISGMAINETITKNNVKYESEELEMAAPSLIGKPILNSHNNDSIENILGKVINAEKVNGGVKYTAEIDADERKIINKIKKGYINKVSIGANVKRLEKEVVEESDGSAIEVYVARGIEFNELSLVPVPGDPNSSITLNNALSESFDIHELNELKLEEEQVEKIEEENILEKNKMAEEIKSQIESLQEENKKLMADLNEMKVKEAKLAEDKKIADLRESLKKEIMEELKSKAIKEEKEEKDEKPAEDESKGIVEPAKAEETDESFKNLVIEKSRGGVNFYYL